MRISDWSSDVCSSDLAPHEGQRFVKGQAIKSGIHRVRALDAAMAVNRCAANIFDPPKQFLAAISADDVAEKPAQITDVFVLAEALRPCFRHPALCMLRIKCSATSCKQLDRKSTRLNSSH